MRTIPESRISSWEFGRRMHGAEIERRKTLSTDGGNALVLKLSGQTSDSRLEKAARLTVPELLPKPTIVRRLVGRKPDANPSLTLSRGLRTHRIPLCLSILDLTKGNEKYARWFRESNLTEEEFAVRNFGIFVDCLDLLCSTSDEVYRYLFIGEVVKTAHVPLESLSELAAVRVHFTGLVTEAFKSYCRRVLDPAAQEMLASELDSIHDFLSAPFDPARWICC